MSNQCKGTIMKKFILSAIVMLSAAHCMAKDRTYYNSNGSIQRREVTRRNSVSVYDRRGCFSGEFRKSGNSLTQTNKGFRSSTIKKY